MKLLVSVLLMCCASAFVVPRRTSFPASSSKLSMVVDQDNIDVFQQFSVLLADVADITTTNDAVTSTPDAVSSESVSYSKWSYYATLITYALSFPGLWSTIKRSTVAKVKRKTYVTPGANSESENSQELKQTAAEIMAYMKANNYDVADTSSDYITFRGIVQRSKSQAFFLTFCTALGLLSLALVLQIQFIDLTLPGIGKPNWFYLALLSPYAGIYYWRSGDRVDDFKVKLSTNDEETENEIAIEGNDEELDRMWRALNWNEKGMIRVEGALEAAE